MSLNLKDWQPESEFLRALDARQEAAIEARGYERAFERAFERGFKLGLVQGVQLVVLQMLDQRFGPLPAKVAKRIDRATFAELNIWSARLLDAKTLAEVFQSASRAKSSAK
ncbi:MAG: hypothetical protein IPN01_24795 [Deltaproteobacteria bacterium]|nr:hypothetical protein [Deltaproteobacteria bacterium]